MFVNVAAGDCSYSRRLVLLPLSVARFTMRFLAVIVLAAVLAVASANDIKEKIRELRELRTPDREVRSAYAQRLTLLLCEAFF